MLEWAGLRDIAGPGPLVRADSLCLAPWAAATADELHQQFGTTSS
jgi:hypothetical protein